MSPKVSTLSDIELALLRNSLHTSLNADGRVVGSSGVRLIVTRDERRLLVGDGFDEDLHARLRRVVASSDLSSDLGDGALGEELVATAKDHSGSAHLTGGPAYVFETLPPVQIPRAVRVVRSTEPGGADAARRCPPNWDEDGWSKLLAGEFGPWAIAVDDDVVASYCHTPGLVTAAGAEAGVWTHPAYRGRRLVETVTATWARIMQAPDRALFYSSDRDNAASQRVAHHLGLREFAWEWQISPGAWPDGDAWGRALADHLSGRYVPRVELETGEGSVGLAMRPDWFFRPHDEWDWWERELLDHATAGPVLDLGAGAGRAALWFQDRGFEVTAVETSPLAQRVCRDRGLRDVRLGDLNDPPIDRAWGAVLLLCGNLGLGGSFEGVRRLLTRLAPLCAPDAVLIGDTVDPTDPGAIRLRIRYNGEVTPWWDQYNIPTSEVSAIVEGTGWVLDRHLIDGSDHAVLLRRDATS